jgi:hypothetical protein
MNLNDEDLQNAIDRGDVIDDSSGDVKAYRRVFDALSNEPSIKLPVNFADTVIQKAMAQNQKRESSRDIWWLGLGVFMMLIALMICVAFVGAKFNLGFLREMADYSGLLVAGVVLITIFNILDKTLVRAREEMQ